MNRENKLEVAHSDFCRLARGALMRTSRRCLHHSETRSLIVHESVDPSWGGENGRGVCCQVFPVMIKYLPAVRARGQG